LQIYEKSLKLALCEAFSLTREGFRVRDGMLRSCDFCKKNRAGRNN